MLLHAARLSIYAQGGYSFYTLTYSIRLTRNVGKKNKIGEQSTRLEQAVSYLWEQVLQWTPSTFMFPPLSQKP